MLHHVKNPKVPHQWGEVGQTFIQVQFTHLLTHLFGFPAHCLKPLGTMRKGNHDEERRANPGQ